MLQVDPTVNTALIVGTVGESPEELLADYAGISIKHIGVIFTPYVKGCKSVHIPVNIYLAEGSGLKFYVVERHHSTTYPLYPHELHKEICAYMYALIKVLKVRFIISTSAVGGLNGNNFQYNFTKLSCGTLAVPGSFIDLAGVPVTFATEEWRRNGNFRLHEGHQAVHDAVCPNLLNMLGEGPVLTSRRSVVATTIGPHFESPAEAAFYHRVVRADFLGMHTLIKEWKLVVQVPNVHFLPIVHVTNMPLEDKAEDTSGDHVEKAASDSNGLMLDQVFRVMRNIISTPQRSCTCASRGDIFDNLEPLHPVKE
jgi:purine nucleoside phosphorylase